MRIGLAFLLACAHGRTPLAPSVPRPLSERADPLVAAADHAQRALLSPLYAEFNTAYWSQMDWNTDIMVGSSLL